MSSDLHPNFHYDVQSEETKLRREYQTVLGKLETAERVLNSREPKYAPIRTFSGKTKVWVERLNEWVTVIEGDGEVDTKGVHDAIRQWELEGE